MELVFLANKLDPANLSSCFLPIVSLQVNTSIYAAYLKATGFLLCAYIVLLFTCQQAVSFSRGYWLSMWTDDPVHNGTQQHTELRVGVFGALGVVQGSWNSLT